MPDEGGYQEAFDQWARQYVEGSHMMRPAIPPFPLEQFDGCTGVPDEARHCCLCHDVDYWHSVSGEDRRVADRALRDCILREADYDEPYWRWLWVARAWVIYAGVRCLGWLYAGRGSGLNKL